MEHRPLLVRGGGLSRSPLDVRRPSKRRGGRGVAREDSVGTERT